MLCLSKVTVTTQPSVWCTNFATRCGSNDKMLLVGETAPDETLRSLGIFLDATFALMFFRIVEFLPSFQDGHRQQLPLSGGPVFCVKWRNWKAHFIWQVNMLDTPQRLGWPKLINLLTDLKEERDVGPYNPWVSEPITKIVNQFEESLKKYPPIKLGTPDPYTPPYK